MCRFRDQNIFIQFTRFLFFAFLPSSNLDFAFSSFSFFSDYSAQMMEVLFFSLNRRLTLFVNEQSRLQASAYIMWARKRDFRHRPILWMFNFMKIMEKFWQTGFNVNHRGDSAESTVHSLYCLATMIRCCRTRKRAIFIRLSLSSLNNIEALSLH